MRKTIALAVAALSCATLAAQDMRLMVMSSTPVVQTKEAHDYMKNQLRLTAGVKRVRTDPESKRISVTYDAEKVEKKTILSALQKIGYTASVVSEGKAEDKKVKVVDATSGATPNAKKPQEQTPHPVN